MGCYRDTADPQVDHRFLRVTTVTPLDPDDAVTPLYAQLAAVLRERIASGDLARRVPSVKTLAQQYAVSQGTAERALRILKDEGLVRSAMGRGTFVVPQARPGSAG